MVCFAAIESAISDPESISWTDELANVALDVVVPALSIRINGRRPDPRP